MSDKAIARGDDTTAATKGERRFAFGENWAAFLEVVDEGRIESAERSLMRMLGGTRLDGRRFLDIGCGSGLFSLAAARLGAEVTAFDYDPRCVAVSNELQRRFPTEHRGFAVAQGSVLDACFLDRLGEFDIVYSWGVLHHTGEMWRAIDAAAGKVAPGGRLFIAIYNDQNLVSKGWQRVKRIYCSGWPGRWFVKAAFFPLFAAAGLFEDVLSRRNPIERYSGYHRERGMSCVHDWIDWLGGYPYEVAKPGDLFEYLAKRGFSLERLLTKPTLGCNEYVFRNCGSSRRPEDAS